MKFENSSIDLESDALLSLQIKKNKSLKAGLKKRVQKSYPKKFGKVHKKSPVSKSLFKYSLLSNYQKRNSGTSVFQWILKIS